ncbi:putative membrane transporter protein YunE [Porphyridium purpureum]|uniref:Putative membrane transporter protein YunE n=1 Tax=Porphyridium purpureum TaxID=35688 RepID=A0A5J4Z8N8_PORPP|nr:putative membrane transporter protein YunE [Porphyridium purpureum]|eukprot:POR7178..scf295_1
MEELAQSSCADDAHAARIEEDEGLARDGSEADDSDAGDLSDADHADVDMEAQVDATAAADGDTCTSPCVRDGVKGAAIGLVGGWVGALIGLGGGIIITPLLTATAGLIQKEAHGTTLIVVAMNSLTSAIVYMQGGSVAVPQAFLLCLGALSTSYFGALVTSKVDSHRLRQFFGVFLLLVSVLLMVPSSVHHTQSESSQNGGRAWVSHVILLGIGCVTGFFCGLLGIGGGTVMVPSLILSGFGQKIAQGTALTAMILPSVLGGVGHWRLGHVQAGLLPGLLTGGLAGAALGAKLAIYMPDRALKLVCGAVFFCMGCRYLFTGSHQAPEVQ